MEKSNSEGKINWTPPLVLTYQPPVVQTNEELDKHIGALVTLRGIASRGPNSKILGRVLVSATDSHWRKEVYAVGILIKLQYQPYLDGNGNLIPIPEDRPLYRLYSSFEGESAKTKLVNKKKVPGAKNKLTK